jgi:hypothetical protein
VVKRPQDNITGRTYLERGQPIVVLVRWGGKGPRNVLIQRADGTMVVRPFRGLRSLAQAVARGQLIGSKGWDTHRNERQAPGFPTGPSNTQQLNPSSDGFATSAT